MTDRADVIARLSKLDLAAVRKHFGELMKELAAKVDAGDKAAAAAKADAEARYLAGAIALAADVEMILRPGASGAIVRALDLPDSAMPDLADVVLTRSGEPPAQPRHRPVATPARLPTNPPAPPKQFVQQPAAQIAPRPVARPAPPAPRGTVTYGAPAVPERLPTGPDAIDDEIPW